MAMARKWRPATFKEMTGQDHVVRTIENAIRADRIHHAFLFTGTRGVGKTTSARIFAKILNCEALIGIDPCGHCPSCQSISSGQSIDVLEIDGATNTSVDDVRSLIEQMGYAPMHGKYRIVIIDEVHMLTKNAFNALLKTLEEPPAHAKFIFATTEANKVPQTILSRVQRFDFKRISLNNILERLAFICDQEQIAFEEDALRIVADQADGSMRDGLTLFDQVYSFCGNQLSAEGVREVLGIAPENYYHDLLQALADHDVAAAIEVVEAFLQKGVELDTLVEGLLKYLRDAVCVKTTKMSPAQIGISEQSFQKISELGQQFGQGDFLRLAKITTDILKEMKDGPHPRIALEVGLARMAYLDRVATIRKLLALKMDAQSEAIATSEVEKKKPY